MKTFLIYSLITVINLILSFLIYIYSFTTQATPYLTEDQRMDSALSMFSTTLLAYLIAAILISLVYYYVAKKYSHPLQN
jgi:hypothetical protein